MPPKKRKLSKEEQRKLIEEYQIKFEGPEPPRNWPSHYAHLFSTIRSIWGTRYDEYRGQDRVHKRLVDANKLFAKQLRNEAKKFRNGTSINESTWRGGIEGKVVSRLTDLAISFQCEHCGKDNRRADFEAEGFSEDEKTRLDARRKRSQKCTCHEREVHMKDIDYDSNSDDEHNGMIFTSAAEELIHHDPADKLDDISIPMRPDKVVGLSMNDRYRRYIASYPSDIQHCPVNGPEMLYPFLLVEAKRGEDAPGFRAIEAQTAFPIRRLLKAQANIFQADISSQRPLLWFFGFQGDEWRLYAGTLEDARVRIFDLWLGTVESYDGALQLIQIVDFIWDWARYIYRPAIRNALRQGRRSLSPSSTATFLRAPSIVSIGSMQTHKLSTRQRTISTPMMKHDSPSYDVQVQEGTRHPLLRRFLYQDSQPWAHQTKVSHSNVATCSFHMLQLLETAEAFPSLLRSLTSGGDSNNLILSIRPLIQQRQYTILLTRAELDSIEKAWTGSKKGDDTSELSSSKERLTAFFFFHTYVQRQDWQIRRDLYCIVWSLQIEKMISLRTTPNLIPPFNDGDTSLRQYPMAINEIRRVRNLLGNVSIGYAWQDVTLILSHGDADSLDGKHLEWTFPPSQGVTGSVLNQYRSLFRQKSAAPTTPLPPSIFRHSERYIWTRSAEDASGRPDNLPLAIHELKSGGAMLAVKQASWPVDCPRFCLYVLEDGATQDGAKLADLLVHARQHDMYTIRNDADGGVINLTEGDRHVLDSWAEALRNEPNWPC